ncbi:MAG: selenium-dependent xanthine dehydrogenase [Deltaproteobacteria bacterium HGW-Deltaproteobacteria-14]|nr:MAG: selenium-dependent xanthine dehydrogenase [Deltaproteobacteria bacterium HGW-Deltaproteobacteria-14]
MPRLEFTLNGRAVAVDVDGDASLLDVLRDRFGVLSVKDGCQPQGQCGACLALIDGKPRVTCATKAIKAQGKDVVTLEGLTADDRDLVARCFVAAAGLQCGFCIPGLALRAHALVAKNPAPTRDEIAQAVDVHLCRCTGYTKIIDAVELLAKAKRGEGEPEILADGGVGASLARYRGAEMVLGDRPYVDDLRFDGMLIGAMVLSEHARAKVLAIDTSAALAVAGVERVLTWRDVPGERWYGLIYNDWPGFVAAGEEVRCVGDFIACVVAKDKATAFAAAALVKVDYEVRPAVLTPQRGLEPDAPRVNPNHANVLQRTRFARGDVDDALEHSAFVARGTFVSQRIEHLFLEPESAVCVPTADGGLHLYTQGQGIFDDRRQVARFLAMDEGDVFVELVPNGGAFGGKEDMSVQPHAALAARLTGRAVKVALTREQSVRVHPKRHPLTMEYAVGCDAEGRLTAVRARLVGDTGAYASVGGKVLERAAGHACGPYRVPVVAIDAVAVYTNNPPCGAMRGFGANQASFAIEGCLDMLAEQVGLDGWEMRWRNAVEIGDRLATGQVLEKSVGVKRTLEAVRDRYRALRAAGKAVGIACGIKNTGIGNGAVEWGKCRLVVEDDLSVALHQGYTEMGQGLLTVTQQFAAEVTGLPAATFRPRVDATFALGCGQTTGSRATLFAGRAVKSAAEKLKAELDRGLSLAELRGRVFAADIVVDDTTPPDVVVANPKTHTAFGYATQVVVLDARGALEHVIAAHDVGRVVNPALCEGQIEGSVHMGLGFALSEELPCEDGMPVTFKLRDIGVLRARDMPTVEVLLIEEPEPEGPFGAKGVGEIGLVPTAGAVAGALYAFDGKRRFTLPMKDSPAFEAISVGNIKGDRVAWS